MRICINCVTAEPIKQYISKKSKKKLICSYCGKEDDCVKEKSLFNLINLRLQECLIYTGELSQFEQAMIFENGSSTPARHNLWGWLEKLNIANEEIRVKFYEWIGSDNENYFYNRLEDLFVLNDGDLEQNYYEQKWKHLKQKLYSNQRFFNDEIKLFFDRLLEILNKTSPELFSTILKEKIYRARIAEIENLSNFEKFPFKELGPPPNSLTYDQRMTPAGVSVFYSALDRQTCLSEVQPIAGDIVVTAEFQGSRPLKMIDFIKLAEFKPTQIGQHPLSPNYSDNQEAIIFLRNLIKEISKPSKRNKNVRYLSTQVLFEYFNNKYGDVFDGIMYGSVQTGLIGTNAVFFPEKTGLDQLKKQNKESYKIEYIENSLIFHEIDAVNMKSIDKDTYMDFLLDDFIKRRSKFD